MKQKIYVLVVFATLFAGRLSGQTPPRDEFDVLLAVTKLSLARGQTDSVEVTILRSRRYAKGVANLSLASSAKAGIKAIIEPVPGRQDAWKLTISASEGAEPGNYAIIPSCHLYHKIKGTVLTVTIH